MDDSYFKKIGEHALLDEHFEGIENDPDARAAAQSVEDQAFAGAYDILKGATAFLLVATTTLTEEDIARFATGPLAEGDQTFAIMEASALKGTKMQVAELLYQTVVMANSRLASMLETAPSETMIGIFQRFMGEHLAHDMDDLPDPA